MDAAAPQDVGRERDADPGDASDGALFDRADAFNSPDAFALDAFAPDAFAPDAFAPDAFALDAFALDAFALDASLGFPRTIPTCTGVGSLVAHYPFDGANDVTGNGNMLALLAPADFYGRVGVFDATTNVRVPYRVAAAPSLNDVRGVSVLVSPSSSVLTGRRGIVDREDVFGVFQLVDRVSCTTRGVTVSVASPLPVGAWSLVACWDDGARVHLHTASRGAVHTNSRSVGAGVASTTRPFQVGANITADGTTSERFIGALADVRLWQTLSAPTCEF